MSKINVKKQNEKEKKVKISFADNLKHNWFMIKILCSSAPFCFIMMCLDAIRWHGMSFIGGTVWMSFLIHSVEFGEDFGRVLKLSVFMFIIWALSAIWSGFNHEYIGNVYRAKANKKLRLMLYEKARSLDLACYDDPEYYNEFVLSVSESSNAVDRTIQLIDLTITGLVMFFAYGAFFLVKDPVSLAFVTASFILRILFMKAMSKVQFKAKLAENPHERKLKYIHRVFYLKDYAKELRLNKNTTKGLFKDFDASNSDILEVRRKIAKRKWGLDFFSGYVATDLIFDGLYMIYLVFMTAVRAVMSFGSMFVLYNSVWGMRRGMMVLSELLPKAMENALYIGKIRSFLNYETKITSRENLPLPSEIKAICFENVCFRYNEKQDYILKNINLTINPMDKIALVGYNGAGKTTLVKLLMRLYDPVEGRITLDGVDIRDFALESYRERIGTIFQDYCIYAATVEENVVMDNTHADSDAFGKAMKLSGFKTRLEEMPLGADTQLTREFDDEGTDLSGGESQKLATARVFYKPSHLIILDEPSSALDPIAEYQMNRSMNKAANEKSVVFISHRLSTTKDADKIFMLRKGEIIEQGTHGELLDLGGKYADMWQAQASKYV
ncbi:MAG: ABC transporter ATP-binding protein/permease [Oscillospiraceae bacterium]|nr:ABC transporter ATP-binding protein/permease [Oscillospiraceae bacterium]